jgi:hypothetical protein
MRGARQASEQGTLSAEACLAAGLILGAAPVRALTGQTLVDDA